MREQTILIKEVCKKTSAICEFGGIINTSTPIKEVYEFRHENKKPRILLGKKMIAYFGEIIVKVVCVDKENLQLFFIEHSFNYRNYIPGHYNFYHLKPIISVNSEVQDIFVELIDCNHIRITGMILTHLIFCLEKEHNLSDLKDLQSCQDEEPNNMLISEDENEMNQQGKGARVLEDKVNRFNILLHPESGEQSHSSDDIYTEVIEGVNQDLTIILD